MSKETVQARRISYIRYLSMMICFVSGLFMFSGISRVEAYSRLYSKTIDGVTYTYEVIDKSDITKEISVLGVDPGSSTSVRIPDKIDGFKVTSVENSTDPAYAIPTYDYSKVTEVRLPKYLQLISNIFNGSSVSSVSFPYETQWIHTCFQGCYSLKTVFIPPATGTIYSDFSNHIGPVIRGAADSYAAIWARGCHYSFETVSYTPYKQEITCKYKGKTLKYTFKDMSGGDRYYTFKASADTFVQIESSDLNVVLTGRKSAGDFEISPQHAGKAKIILTAEATTAYQSARLEIPIVVSKAKQTIKSKTARTGYCGRKFKLGAKAKGRLSYKSASPAIAKVNKKGVVTCLKPGKAKITITAAATRDYKKAAKTITVTSKLARPKISAMVSRGSAKISWKKTVGAKKYILYAKYPGMKKFKKVLTKPARVRSVTHRGLQTGKRYRYKLKACTRIGGKTYYSPYSRVITIRAR